MIVQALDSIVSVPDQPRLVASNREDVAFELAATTVQEWQQAELARRWESLEGRADFGPVWDEASPAAFVSADVMRTARDPLKWQERLG